MKRKKTGGRRKGSVNKRTKALRAEKDGQTPLDYLLEIMRDKTKDPLMRLDSAKAAAPYLHARRAPEDKKGNVIPTVNYHMPNLEKS